MACEVKEIYDEVMEMDCLAYTRLGNGEIEINLRLSSRGVYVMREDVMWKMAIPGAIDGCRVAGVGEEAFERTMPVRIVTIAPGIRYIGKNAFVGARLLETVQIPGSVEEIGTDAFDIHQEYRAYLRRCWKHEFVWDSEMEETDDVFTYQGRALSDEDMQPLEPIYPDGFGLTFEVEEGSYAQRYAEENGFGYRCAHYIDGDFTYRLRRSEQGETVADIVKYHGRKKTLRIPDTLGNQPVRGIGKDAFSKNMNLIRVSVPEGVMRIGRGAFRKCLNLKAVALPGSLERIDRNAFSGCEMLSRIKLPDGLRQVGYSAFDGCESLQTVRIPGSMQCIREEVFADCTKLREVNMEEGIRAVLADAFRGCSSLKTMHMPRSMMFVSREAFGEDEEK